MNNKNMVTAGLDIGNGYVKGVIRVGDNKASEINIPSCAIAVTNPNNVIPVEAPEAISGAVENILNILDVSFDSPMISRGDRRWIGNRAISANTFGMENFNITANISKAKQDLSPVLAFSCIAGAALQDYYRQTKQLPNDIIEVHCALAVALPIDEYKDYRNEYKAAFKKNFHMVTLHNFVNPVRVKIVVDAIAVGAEGASAQYAISSYGEPLYASLLKTASSYGAALDGLTSAHLIKITNVVGIDIGEGTVNFPVFMNGDFNADASRSIGSGFGTVLEKSIAPCKQAGHPFKGGRKALAEYLQNKPDADDWFIDDYNDVVRIVTNEARGLVNEIVTQFTDIIGSGVRVAYVYGGGAHPMETILYPALIEASKQFAGTKKGFPILYIGSKYSQILNREGLFIMADAHAKRLAESTNAANIKPAAK